MRRPLIYILISLAAGILTGSFFTCSYYAILIAALINLCVLLMAVRKKILTVGLFAIICLTFLTGLFNIQKQNYFVQESRRINNYIDKGDVTVEGIVTESPIPYPDKNVLFVHCLRIVKAKTYIPVSGNIRLSVPSDLNFGYGDFIRFNTTLKNIHNFDNPGGFDYKRYLSLQGIAASGFVHDASGMILLRKDSASGLKLRLEAFRLYLKNIIDKNADSPQREIISAMTLGNQNEIPADIRDNFNKTGTSHILSISGLHIGMVAATSFFLVFIILKSSEYLMLRFNIIKLASAAAFIMILIYAFIAGMGVTVTRSALMALIFLIALFAGRQKDLLNTLALAGLIILAASPESLFDISFQLSFMAVLALIYIVPRIGPLPKHVSLPGWGQKIMQYLYLAVVVCIAATIGTMPLIMYYFNRVSVITIVANIIIVPLLGTLTLAICMFFILCAFFSSAVAGFFIQLASYLTQISVNIINKLASFPWSSFTAGKPNISEILFFYLLVFLFIQFIDERKKTKAANTFPSIRLRLIQYSILMIIVFFAADITILAVKDKLSSDLQVTVIDVGQGNSLMVRFPGGKNMLIDGGGFSGSSFDTGQAVVAPLLYHERIGKIDTVVLTHPHPDHLLGLVYILNNFHVREIWKSGWPVDAEEFPEWHRAIENNKINVRLLSQKSPQKVFNGAAVQILWPPDYFTKTADIFSYDAVNDSSLVLKITFGRIRFLITGDISAEVEKKLIESGADLRSDVLMMPHHGSRRSSSPEFIKAVACRYAIASAGKSNIFKHPHPAVLERYHKAGVTIFRTDRNGAVTITTDGNDLHTNTFVKIN